MKKIISDIPPTIIETPNGRWAVSGSIWIAIGPSVTLDQVRAMWEIPKREIPPKVIVPKNNVIEIQSARTGEIYTLTHNGKEWLCTCMGFGFRHQCKHVKEQMAKEAALRKK